MVNIIKEELPIEEHLRKKLELICEFAKTTRNQKMFETIYAIIFIMRV